MEDNQMNKNLEELKNNKDILTDWESIQLISKILEDFEKRLGKLEKKEEGFRPRIRLIKEAPMKKGGLNEIPTTPRPKEGPKGQRTIKSERMNHLEKGAQIGKSREGPKSYKSGCGIKPKTKRPRPKPRPKIICNYKIGGTDPD